MKGRKRLTLKEVSLLYSRFQSSGLSMAEFARQEQIPYLRLIHYKKRLLSNALLPKDATPQKWLQLLPPKCPSSNPDSLLLRCGPFSLELKHGFSQPLLDDILEVLKHHAQFL